MIEIQVTLCSSMGYRAMSVVIRVPSVEEWNTNKAKYKRHAVESILAKRHMTMQDLQKYGYDTIKTRQYDKEKIEREKAERYEQIKKERGWGKYKKEKKVEKPLNNPEQK